MTHTTTDEAAPVWRRSQRCSNGACVEVASLPDGGMALRDSKDGFTGPVLRFTRDEWEAFAAGVKDGEFDL